MGRCKRPNNAPPVRALAPGQPVPGSGAGRVANKELRRLLKAVKSAGGELSPGGYTGHWKVHLNGTFIGSISGTPSDYRTWKNDIARLRRNGLNITSRGTYDGPVAQS